MIVLNVRHPRDFRGDLAAMIGSARIGERRLGPCSRSSGRRPRTPPSRPYSTAPSARCARSSPSWKDGVYHGEAFLDDDGHGAHDIHIRAKVTKQGSDLEVDLTDSDPQVTGFVNSSYAQHAIGGRGGARLPDRSRRSPKNDGAFRPVSVIAKEGTIVWARPGAPVTLCTNHCGQEIIEAIIKALAPACPERAMAGWGRRFRIAIQGTIRAPGSAFIWHLFQARPGGGASSAGDGWPARASGRRPAASSSAASRCRGALSAALPPPRVPSRQRRRRPLSRRPRRRARAGHGDRRARRRQYRRRRRAPWRLRHPRWQDGKPHQYWLQSAGRPARSRPRRSASCSAPGDVLMCAPAAAAAGDPAGAPPRASRDGAGSGAEARDAVSDGGR